MGGGFKLLTLVSDLLACLERYGMTCADFVRSLEVCWCTKESSGCMESMVDEAPDSMSVGGEVSGNVADYMRVEGASSSARAHLDCAAAEAMDRGEGPDFLDGDEESVGDDGVRVLLLSECGCGTKSTWTSVDLAETGFKMSGEGMAARSAKSTMLTLR